MLQNVQQEGVRGNKALSLIEAIGVVKDMLFVVHLWVLCYLLSFFPVLGSFQNIGQERIIVEHQGDASVLRILCDLDFF
jgi:hypothetical protein